MSFASPLDSPWPHCVIERFCSLQFIKFAKNGSLNSFENIFLGGWSYDQDNQRLLIDTIDKFNHDQGTWEIETRIPTPRFHCGVALVKDKLHIVGGFHSDLTFDRATGKYIEMQR